MYFDRFDIVEAYYIYLQWNSCGMDRNYRRLCKLKTYFKPGAMGITVDTLSDNGRAILDALHRKAGTL